MRQLHLTLTWPWVLGSQVTALLVLGLLLLFVKPTPLLPVGLGLVAGCVAGGLDLIGTRTTPQRFHDARTFGAVLKARWASFAGRTSVAFTVVLMAVVFSRVGSDGVVPLLAAVAAFEALRGPFEIAAIRELRRMRTAV